MGLVREVHHYDIEVEGDVNILLRQSKISLTPLHVAHYSRAVGIARHEQGTRAHKQVELAAKELHRVGVFIVPGLVVDAFLFLETNQILSLVTLRLVVETKKIVTHDYDKNIIIRICMEIMRTSMARG